jgi:hypothetical protein
MRKRGCAIPKVHGSARGYKRQQTQERFKPFNVEHWLLSYAARFCADSNASSISTKSFISDLIVGPEGGEETPA